MASTFYQDYDHQSAKPLPDALLEVFGVSNDGRSGAGDLQRVLEAKRWRFYFIFLIRWLEGAFLEHRPPLYRPETVFQAQTAVLYENPAGG